MNLFDLSGKTALVIGGNGVLGSAFAEGLAEHGAQVAIAGRDQKKADTVVGQLRTSGADASAFEVDVTDKNSIKAMTDAVLNHYGRIDILLNCAGVNSKTPFFEIEEDEWDNILSVNAKSIFMTSQVVGKRMVDAGKGSIINISSVSSEVPLSGVFAYSASKAALNNMTKYLARELAPSVRVNAIVPGFFPAEQNRKILTQERVENICRHTPLNRLGDAPELKGAAVWLASDAASGFVTGALIPVDGGFTAMTI